MEPQMIAAIVAGAVLLTLLILLIVLLASFSRRNSEMNLRLHEIEDALDDGLRALEGRVDQVAMIQRENLLRSVQTVNDSLLGALSAASQQQAARLDAARQQSFDSNQAQELRQHRMYQMTDERLAKYEQQAQSVQALLDQKLQQNEERLERMRLTLEGSLTRMQTENAQKLDEMRRTVDEKLHETLDQRLNASFAQVSERLEQVYRSLGEVHSLATGVGDLKRVLSNVKTRGVWGEMQLGNLLEQTLANTQYVTNAVMRPGSAERVEFAVCLPGQGVGEPPVYLPLDSKFPQEDYARLAEASAQSDAAAVESAQKQLLAAVRTEAKRISGKYIEPPYTTDFAVMFLPLEGLYAEVMRHADVVEQIQREQRVLISGPSTLLALLNSLQMGFRTLAIQQRSAEVWRLLGAVKTDFGEFAQVLQKTQEKLHQASDTIETAFVRTRTIERKLRRVESLDVLETQQLLAPETGMGEDATSPTSAPEA